MLKTNFERILLLVAVILLSVGMASGLSPSKELHSIGIILRCAAILLLAVFALRRRSLTPWIFVAMVAGAELGFDAPHFAVGPRRC